jgi:hypothetical protein
MTEGLGPRMQQDEDEEEDDTAAKSSGMFSMFTNLVRRRQLFTRPWGHAEMIICQRPASCFHLPTVNTSCYLTSGARQGIRCRRPGACAVW